MSRRDLAWLLVGEWATLTAIAAGRILHRHARAAHHARLSATR